MVIWCRTALLLAIALPAEVSAQHGVPRVPRPADNLGELIGQSTRRLAPSFALVGGDAELGIDGIISWAEADDRPGLSVRLGAFGRRITRQSWGGAGAGVGYRVPAGAARFWIGVDATAGTGAGPDGAFIVRAGGRLGRVALELRSGWSGTGRSVDSDSLFDSPAGPVTRVARHTEAELRTEGRLGPVSLEAVGGLRFGEQVRQGEWGWLTLATGVARQVDLFTSFGSRPEQRDRGGLSGGFFQVGLRLQVVRTGTTTDAAPMLPPAPAPSMRVDRGEGDAWVLTLQIPAARSVEVTGDLTGWSSVSLVRARGEPTLWRATLHAAPGVYHIVLRIDKGPWWVPPGLASVPDGFNGKAGLLELR